MNKKYDGSILIWVVCLFIFITSIVALNLKNSYEDKSSLKYELDDFKLEQGLYTAMLIFTEQNKDKIRKIIYNNPYSQDYNFKNSFNLSEDFKNSDILFKSIYINDDIVDFNIYNTDLDKTRSLFFSLNTLNEIFEYKKNFIDNSSKNELQNKKNKIINETISNPEFHLNNVIKTKLELEDGDYDFLFKDNFLYIDKNGEEIQKYTRSDYRRLAIISKSNTNINMHSERIVYLDKLFIINEGNVSLNNIYFKGIILIKNGNLYADNILGEGKILVDGNVISNDLKDGEIINFKSKNKYAMMFDSMLNFNIKLFKR